MQRIGVDINLNINMALSGSWCGMCRVPLSTFFSNTYFIVNKLTNNTIKKTMISVVLLYFQQYSPSF